MKLTIAWSKSILLTFCLILTVATIVSAQRNSTADSESSELQTKRKPSAEELEKFYELTKSTAAAFSAGEKENAKAYAQTLLKQAEMLPNDWNYGNAIHIANLVLGLIALDAGNVKEAKQHLLAAGNIKGSPQLNSFGPNMRLAKALLEKNESEAVIEYFDLCAKFWKPQFSKIDEWKAAVKKNEMPDFGPNLVYQLK